MESTYTTKVVVAVCVVVALIAFIGGYLLRDTKSDPEGTPTVTPSPYVITSYTPVVTPAPAYKPVSYTIKLTSSGVSPVSLTIRRGDSVTLLNSTDTAFWPASNPHPAHSDCPGFDALRGLRNGESYTLTFTQMQTCGYHNHLDPANSTMWGTITVQ